MYYIRFVLFALYFIATVQNLSSQDKFLTSTLSSIETFKEFLAIPNDANHLDDIALNVEWCTDQLMRRGFGTQVISTATTPILYADKISAGDNRPVVLFYFHADGQSVDPQFWYQENPYQAVLKSEVEGEGWVTVDWNQLNVNAFDPELRIFARSSSDSKCNIMMLLIALDMMKAEGIDLPYNLKLIIDFEEEKSSPNLAAAVEANKELLSADMLVIYDGPRHVSGEPTIAFGARGIAEIALTVYGPLFAQHSGHYGNYVPNPALKLSQLLGSMKDEYGRVQIPGFYDGVEIDEATEAILAAVPDDEPMLRAKLGISQIDSVSDTYQKALQYPTLNIRGMASGWVGSEARTIVPAQAVAEMDIRLVKESDPERLIALVRSHIESEGYHVIADKPTQRERLQYGKICRMESSIAYKAFRTEFDSEIGRWLTRALTNAFGRTPVRERTMGGSIPISPFVNILNVPGVVVPLANKDNNQHSPNENLRLGNYVDGVRSMYAILSTPI
jgi:acetylornithine deacetylase/succinyl-diaminopimelate desuccinylase-like protein